MCCNFIPRHDCGVCDAIEVEEWFPSWLINNIPEKWKWKRQLFETLVYLVPGVFFFYVMSWFSPRLSTVSLYHSTVNFSAVFNFHFQHTCRRFAKKNVHPYELLKNNVLYVVDIDFANLCTVKEFTLIRWQFLPAIYSLRLAHQI